MTVSDNPTLASLVGQTIIARIPVVREEGPVTVKLLSVDDGGIWIESYSTTDHWLSEMKISASLSTFVFFVPYQQLYWVMAFQDRVSLSEQGFGVHDGELRE